MDFFELCENILTAVHDVIVILMTTCITTVNTTSNFSHSQINILGKLLWLVNTSFSHEEFLLFQTVVGHLFDRVYYIAHLSNFVIVINFVISLKQNIVRFSALFFYST